MAKTRGTGLLMVWADIDPQFEAEYHRWYDEEHIANLMAVPGFLSAGRYVALKGGPKYLALYELEAPEVLQSPAFLDGVRFRMTVHEPVAFEPTGDHDHDVLALTARINEIIEQCVRCRPSQWLWIHRRWPKEGDRPRKRRGQEAQALAGKGVRVESDGSSFI